MQKKQKQLNTLGKKMEKVRTMRGNLSFILKKNFNSRIEKDALKFKKLVQILRNNKSITHVVEKSGYTKPGALQIIRELRKAAEEGYSLNQYLEKGRPFHYGKKVVAE